MAGTTINPYRFGGQIGYRRDGTNRNYVRSRNLDTARGRWISTDPIGFNDSNIYGYAENNPVILGDPTGNASSGAPQYPNDPGFRCPKTGKELSLINKICKVDQWMYVNDSDTISNVPANILKAMGPCLANNYQATTSCRVCSNGQVVGVTYFDSSFGCLPSIYQHCLWLHEKRRRYCCATTGQPDLTGANDHWQNLNCVWKALQSCRVKNLQLQSPACQPPPLPSRPGPECQAPPSSIVPSRL